MVPGEADAPDAEEEYRTPKAVNVFAGPRAPLACALAWCGWEVEVVELKLGPEHDLSCAEVREKVDKYLEEADAAFFAVPCKTWSRERDHKNLGVLQRLLYQSGLALLKLYQKLSKF